MDRLEIVTPRCPSCGGQTLFIGKGGHLTCSVIGCKEPGVERAINNLRSEVERLRAKLERAREALHKNELTFGDFEKALRILGRVGMSEGLNIAKNATTQALADLEDK